MKRRQNRKVRHQPDTDSVKDLLAAEYRFAHSCWFIWAPEGISNFHFDLSKIAFSRACRLYGTVDTNCNVLRAKIHGSNGKDRKEPTTKGLPVMAALT